MISLIAAVAMNGVIGNSKLSKMPWYNREEMAFFKEQTMGKIVVMGRKTAEETGKLMGRDCLVLTKQKGYKLAGFRTVTVEELLTMNEINFDLRLMICGGAEVYKKLMPYASNAMISHMDFDATGDILLPEFDKKVWKKAQAIEKKSFTAIHYINTNPKKFVI